MNRSNAEVEIRRIFAAYHSLKPADDHLLATLSKGKLYELYVLSILVADLSARGLSLTFHPSTTHGSALRFKAGPGAIKANDSHFEVTAPDGSDYWLFVDIEFETLGSHRTGHTVRDNSRTHELDLVVVRKRSGYPLNSEIALGVECKSTPNFTKGIVKEALGVRRELSLLADPATPSTLSNAGASPAVRVPANPPSEFWLAFIDPKGSNYSQSPAAFGIDLRHLEP